MTTETFVARHLIPLQPGAGLKHPQQPPELVGADSPALEVFTDFHLVQPITDRPGTRIDDALDNMKTAGVRLLLIVDDGNEIIGLVTSTDIQGERPIKLMQEDRIERNAIAVSMIMTPQSDIVALDMRSVIDSQVGHIIETLNQVEQRHILVVEVEPDTGRQCVRGLFSTSQIGKQLGHGVLDDMHPARSLLDMIHQVV